MLQPQDKGAAMRKLVVFLLSLGVAAVAAGAAVAKPKLSDISVSKKIDKASPSLSTGSGNIVSPRDPASGLPTGRRTYKPIR